MRRILQWLLKWAGVAVLAKYRPKIVAITGSVGKSSAKEAIFLILNQAFPGKVARSRNNLNTEIGVPLAVVRGVDAKRNVFLWLKNFGRAMRLLLFKSADYPEILVLEMAADRPGDIAYLTSFIEPDVAVVTAIGEMPSHLEFFPERDDYIGEKSAVLKSLKPGGAAILNYDDLSVREMRDIVPTDRARLYYGFGAGAEIAAADFSYNIPNSASEIPKAGLEFKVEDRMSGESAVFKVSRAIGVPTAYAALAGAAVGRAFGVSLAVAAEAALSFAPPRRRLELIRGIKDTIIIDDSYNSSPLACEAALDVLAKFKKNRKVAVLGSMLELGRNAEEAHRLIGRKAAKTSDVVALVGDEMVLAKEEAIRFGLKNGVDLFWFETSEEAGEKTRHLLRPGDAVLIKGSLGVRMKKVVEAVALKIPNF